MKQVDIEHLLPRVEKPSRYIDHEINACHKDFAAAEVRFAFAFPDVYELGVSHLGLKILYSIINELDYAMADRIYLPWADLNLLMREARLPLFGIESRIEARAFDILGITLQSELTYTNVLELIDLAGIPVHWNQRDEACPIVMAGGPCAANPLPLAPFVDVFFIGEAEEAIIQIALILRERKSRSSRLEMLAALESCYVPALHGYAPAKAISIRKYVNFSEPGLQHKPQLLSWQLATHNRYVAEIMRGCSRGCRFCHAGYFYRPVRERSPEMILQDLLAEVQQSGWDEAGLISLSSSDYSCIQEVLLSLLNAVDTHKTHISLPSLRVDSLDDSLVQVLKSLGREGLTIAPEAGSQRLREVINKNLSEEDILKGIEIALKLGWQKIKLYFMLGLPTEDESDIDGIIELIDKINTMGKRRMQINITLSPFVPKPFTPFGWCAMLDRDTLLDRARRIKTAYFKNRNIKIKYHTIENSLLEAVLARGDLQVAYALEAAWKKGASFDGWNECFDYSTWEAAFKESNTDISLYLNAWETEQALPWDFIDTGVSKEFLLSELAKAEQGIQTPDCRELCTLCGVCNSELQTHNAKSPAVGMAEKEGVRGAGLPADKGKKVIVEPGKAPPLQYRYRVHYQKVGLLRFISHLDWMRMLFRRVAVLELQTVFTQGFNPHPKVSLSPPLPVGVEGTAEFFDISFYAPYSPDLIIQEFRQTQIPDFILLGCESQSGKSALPLAECVSLKIPADLAEEAKVRISQFLAKESFSYTKATATRQKSYDLSSIILRMEWQHGELLIEKKLESPALYDVLAAIFLWDKKLLYSIPITRTGYIADALAALSPEA